MLISACRRHALVVALCLLPAAPVCAQESPDELLEEFIHYTLIAKPDLASGYAERLFESGATNAELAETIDDSRAMRERFDRAIGKAHRVSELQDIAADLDRRVSEGRLDLARDPERIDRAIVMLTGTQRERLHGQRQLTAAGEYAVPRLLRVVTEGKDERLRSACLDMLVTIGRRAVSPLCAALPYLDARNRRLICNVLGEIGLPEAAPYVAALLAEETVAEAVKDAARRAFNDVGGTPAPVSTLFADLGLRFFNEEESLVAYPFEATNNVWSYDALFGLETTPVPTEVFGEIRAMWCAARAIEADTTNDRAIGLFVAANLRRENELPAGAADPIYGGNPYSPDFYATVFGTRICQDVLEMALDRLDTPLVRDAIAALADTTGGANLFGGARGRQPLLEALQYPDRRVQYEAALTLGQALPTQTFPGDVMVVPLLASAVRSGDEAYAAVIAPNEEDRRIDAVRLEGLGFSIVAAGDSFQAIAPEVGGAVGVDLVTVHAFGADEAAEEVSRIHAFPKTAAVPVLVVAAATDMPELKATFRDDVRVKVARARTSEDQFAEAVDDVMLRAAGGRMTEAEAEAYAINAIMTLRDIAIAGNTAFTINDAESALAQALTARSGELRLMIADILALIDSATAQRTLLDAALAATDDERIELLDRVGASVRHYGNRAEGRHVAALLDLIRNSGGATAEAAARVHGAMVLPPETAIELIPATGG